MTGSTSTPISSSRSTVPDRPGPFRRFSSLLEPGALSLSRDSVLPIAIAVIGAVLHHKTGDHGDSRVDSLLSGILIYWALVTVGSFDISASRTRRAILPSRRGSLLSARICDRSFAVHAARSLQHRNVRQRFSDYRHSHVVDSRNEKIVDSYPSESSGGGESCRFTLDRGLGSGCASNRTLSDRNHDCRSKTTAVLVRARRVPLSRCHTLHSEIGRGRRCASRMHRIADLPFAAQNHRGGFHRPGPQAGGLVPAGGSGSVPDHDLDRPAQGGDLDRRRSRWRSGLPLLARRHRHRTIFSARVYRLHPDRRTAASKNERAVYQRRLSQVSPTEYYPVRFCLTPTR